MKTRLYTMSVYRLLIGPMSRPRNLSVYFGSQSAKGFLANSYDGHSRRRLHRNGVFYPKRSRLGIGRVADDYRYLIGGDRSGDD